MINNALTVTQVNTYIKALLDEDIHLKNIFIVGEISNFLHYFRSGHIYFTLKDENTQIKAVMFSSSASRLKFKPSDGMKVLCRGRISLYDKDGAYQLYVDDMQPDGIGSLTIAFEQMKEKLSKEGLFDDIYKKTIPKYPKKIGVATSDVGAAIEDIKNITKRRYPIAELVISPTIVQGDKAANDIAKSIKILDERGDIDVIIVGRGGGSLEDLWAFNTEQVARAVFDCNTPVISAVGHETDYTICDFVSDLRAPTPSAAAELAVPDSNVLIDFLDNANKRLSALLNDRIEREYQKLDNLMLSSFMAEPGEYFSQKFDEVDVLYARLKDGFSYLVEKENSKFSNLVSSLDALSPLKVLARGYSITTKNEKVIRDIEDINIDDELKVKLSKGYTKCVVKEVVSDE